MTKEKTGRESEISQVPGEAHEKLGNHILEYSKQDGIHKMKLHHPKGHGVVEVHSASAKSLHAHLESVSISMRSMTPIAKREIPAKVAPPLDDHFGQLKANEGSVFTRLSPVQDGHNFCFSLQDVGSIYENKHKYYQTWGHWLDVEETLKVTNKSGDMMISIQEYLDSKWSNIKKDGKVISRQRMTYQKGMEQKFGVWSPRYGYWHMELYGIAPTTDYTLKAGWVEGDLLLTKKEWEKPPKDGSKKLV